MRSCFYPLPVVLLVAIQSSFISSHEPATHTNTLDTSQTPTFRGWTSWSLQAFKKPGYGEDWFKEDNIKRQVDALAKDFKEAGFTHVNLDSGWQDDKLDQYGRYQLHKVRFPSGLPSLQSYLEERGLSLGLFLLPGIDARAVDNKTPVLGTKYTADQIIQCPTPSDQCKRRPANAFGAGLTLDFSHPGAQAYIDSVVDLLYSWKVTFVKYAGYVPGSSIDPNNADFSGASSAADLAAWRSAIDRLHQTRYSHQPKIWLSAAWEIAKSEKQILKTNADSHRVAIDIAAYSTVMTTFDRVIRNAKVAASWSSVPANQGGTVLDLDAILLADLSITESQTMVTLWALLGSPIYSGDDLTLLSSVRRALLTNPRVLNVAQQLSSKPAVLLNYHEPSASTTQARHRLMRRDGREPLADCDRRVLKECQEKICASLGIDSQKVFGLHTSSYVKLSTDAATTSGSSGSDDVWERQVWYAEAADVIYLGLVNAGQQLPSDGPAEIKVELKKLSLKTPLAKSYTIVDVWTGHDVASVDGSGVVSSGTLSAHESRLYMLKPKA